MAYQTDLPDLPAELQHITVPDYPMWIHAMSHRGGVTDDDYFVTMYEGRLYGINTIMGRNYCAFLCYIDKDGFHWAGEKHIRSRYFNTKEELWEYRDHVMTHLPSVVVLGSLS